MYAHKLDYPVLIIAPDRRGKVKSKHGNMYMIVPVVLKAQVHYAPTRAAAEKIADTINPEWRNFKQ